MVQSVCTSGTWKCSSQCKRRKFSTTILLGFNLLGGEWYQEDCNLGILEPCNPGTFQPWNLGTPRTFEPCILGTLEPWSPTLQPGSLQLWNPAPFQISVGNSVKSSVPQVFTLQNPAFSRRKEERRSRLSRYALPQLNFWILQKKKRRFCHLPLHIHCLYCVGQPLRIKTILYACIRIRGICLNCMWRSGLMRIGNSFNHQKSQCLGVIPCCEGSCLELYWLLLFHQARNTNPQLSTTISCTMRIFEMFRAVDSSNGSKFLEMSSIIMIHQYSSYNKCIYCIYIYIYTYLHIYIHICIYCIYTYIYILYIIV